MKLGDRNRCVGVTDMNAHSSRSHAVFIVNVECAENDEAGESHIRSVAQPRAHSATHTHTRCA